MAAVASRSPFPSLRGGQPCSDAADDRPILVVGRGIIGATIALRLAYAGRRVVVVGSTPTATNLAFGWLGGHQTGSRLRHTLNRLSRSAWEALLDTHLGREGYVPGGCLMYAADHSPGGVARLESTARQYRGLGFPAHALGAEALAELAPALAGRVCSAMLLPDDAVVDGRWAAGRALARAVELGAEVWEGSVASFQRSPEGAVAGAVLSDGTAIPCSSLVLAAGGKGNHQLGNLLGLSMPIKGIWGIKVKTAPLARRLVPGIAMLKHYSQECGASAGISYGQYPDNSFCINEKLMEGTDMEARLRWWLDYFADIWPELREAEIAYMTKTVRWVPKDGGHVCGFAPAPNAGVYVALTNSDGINMSALLSEVAAAELCGGASGLMAQCLPGRFADDRPAQSRAALGAPGQCGSGDGALENVGVLVGGRFGCPDCLQRFDSERALQAHARFAHGPRRGPGD